MPAGVVAATQVRPGEESYRVSDSEALTSLRASAVATLGASALLRLRSPLALPQASMVHQQQSADRALSKDVVERTAYQVEQGSVGLPVGVQVAARHWREDIVLAVMAAIEEHFQSQPDYPAHPPV